MGQCMSTPLLQTRTRKRLRREAHEELCKEVESLRTTAYDPTNAVHSSLLAQLWNLINPNDPIDGMKSERWVEIGFQDNDPSTDFRGMGVLSLHQLIHFVQNEPEKARVVLSISNHPTNGFPFAVAGINFTALTRKFLQEGLLKSHFYNTLDHAESIDDFHHAYVRIFTLFAEFYTKENPATVMEFTVILIKFESALRRRLQTRAANLDSISVDDL